MYHIITKNSFIKLSINLFGVGVGVGVGCLTLLRPIIQFLVVGIPVLYIFLWWKSQTRSFYVRHTAVFVVGLPQNPHLLACLALGSGSTIERGLRARIGS